MSRHDTPEFLSGRACLTGAAVFVEVKCGMGVAEDGMYSTYRSRRRPASRRRAYTDDRGRPCSCRRTGRVDSGCPLWCHPRSLSVAHPRGGGRTRTGLTRRHRVQGGVQWSLEPERRRTNWAWGLQTFAAAASFKFFVGPLPRELRTGWCRHRGSPETRRLVQPYRHGRPVKLATATHSPQRQKQWTHFTAAQRFHHHGPREA